ncbi:MAG: hypothetical protein MSC46_00755 [Campylobacter sp.]|nr:hypothetical protein [Campylobacter sp.]
MSLIDFKTIIIVGKQELESSGILENLTRLPRLLVITDSNFLFRIR